MYYNLLYYNDLFLLLFNIFCNKCRKDKRQYFWNKRINFFFKTNYLLKLTLKIFPIPQYYKKYAKIVFDNYFMHHVL